MRKKYAIKKRAIYLGLSLAFLGINFNSAFAEPCNGMAFLCCKAPMYWKSSLWVLIEYSVTQRCEDVGAISASDCGDGTYFLNGNPYTTSWSDACLSTHRVRQKKKES